MHGVSDLISQICLRLLRSSGGGRVQESFQGRHFKSMCLYTALFICALIWPLLLYTVSGIYTTLLKYYFYCLCIVSNCRLFWAPISCEIIGVCLREAKGPMRLPSAHKNLCQHIKRQSFFRGNEPSTIICTTNVLCIWICMWHFLKWAAAVKAILKEPQRK